MYGPSEEVYERRLENPYTSKREEGEDFAAITKAPSFLSQCCHFLQSLYSIRIFFSLFSFLSLFFLGLTLTLIFFSSSTSNVETVFYENQRSILSYLQTYTEEWLSLGPYAITQNQAFIDRYESTFESLGFYDNTTQSRQDLLDLSYNMLRLVRSSYGITSLLFCTYDGLMVATGVKNHGLVNEVNQIGKRNYTLWYNFTESGPIGASYYTNVDIRPRNYTLLMPFRLLKTNVDPMREERVKWVQEGYNYTDYVWNNYKTGLGRIVSTVTIEWKDSKGVSRGVMGSQIDLTGYRDFFSDLEFLEGDIFLIDQGDDLLLASSIEESVVVENKRVKPQNSNIPYLKKISQHLIKKYGSLSNIKGIVDPMYIYGDDNQRKLYIVSCVQFEVKNFKILAMYIVPNDVVFKQINAGNTISLLVASLTILLVGVLSTFSIHCCLRPILRLEKKMTLIKTMKMEDIKMEKRGLFDSLYEVKSINDSFQMMVDKLIQYRAFLPNFMKKDDDDDSDVSDTPSENSSTTSISSNGSHKNSSKGSTNSPTSPHHSFSNYNADIFDVGLICVNCTLVRFVFCTLLYYQVPNFVGLFYRIVKAFENGKGTIMRVSADEILISFRGCEYALDQAIRIRDAVKEILLDAKPSVIDFRIFIEEAEFTKGVLGSDNLKALSIIFPRNFYDKVIKFGRRNSIILTGETAIKYEKHYDFLPVDLVKLSRYDTGVADPILVVECCGNCKDEAKKVFFTSVYSISRGVKIKKSLEELEKYIASNVQKGKFRKRKCNDFKSFGEKCRDSGKWGLFTMIKEIEENNSFIYRL